MQQRYLILQSMIRTGSGCLRIVSSIITSREVWRKTFQKEYMMLLLIELGKPFDFLWKLAAYPDTSNHF